MGRWDNQKQPSYWNFPTGFLLGGFTMLGALILVDLITRFLFD